MTQTLNLYGCSFRFHCQQDPAFTAEIIRPFKYFWTDKLSTVTAEIHVHLTEPPYQELPTLDTSFVTPRNSIYKEKNRKIIDYPGNALVIQNSNDSIYDVFSLDRSLIREIGYMLVLSHLNLHCDQHGLLRIHASAFSFRDQAMLLMMPAGGGKSTLILSLLAAPGFKIIAEDTSIVDKNCFLYPYPLPLSLRSPDALAPVPSKFVWEEKRMSSEPKFRVDLDYWPGKIEKRSIKNPVLIAGMRRLNGLPEIRKGSKIQCLTCLLRDAVIGMGIFQLPEFMFQRSMKEVLMRIPYYLKRLANAFRLCLNSPFYVFYLSRNNEANVKALEKFLSG